MTRTRTVLAVSFGLLMAGGCATPRPEPPPEVPPVAVIDVVREQEREEPPAPPPAPPVVPPPVDPTSAALSYFDRVRRMPAAELARELEATRTAYGRTLSDTDRMRVAMLLALPNTAVTDEARALEMLEPIVKNPGHGLHTLAVLLSTYVQEQRRLGQSAQALQKDAQTLQQKLDALRSLERALSEREGAGPRRR